MAIFPARGPIAIPASATPQALAALPLVLFEPRRRTRRLVDDWFEEAGLAAKPVMELGSTEAMKEIVAAGPLRRAAQAGGVGRGRRDALTVLPLAPRLARTLAIVMRGAKPLSRGLRHLREALLGLRV